MGCCHYFESIENGADAFTVEMPRMTFGRGVLREVGARIRARGLHRVALVTDPFLKDIQHVETVRAALSASGVGFEEYSEVVIEPTDASVLDAARFIAEADIEGVVSVGGGSVMDTVKAALVYAIHPADFTTYFPPPIGDGVPLPGPLPVHIACPTTAGTGSEATGLSVVRIEALDTKYVLHSRYILPTEAIIDAGCADTLPATIIASSGFDLLSHAIECYTARAYTRWERVAAPDKRPMTQGANPWSDLHAREALRIAGTYLERAVADADDHEARGRMMWAASLAGMAFGNSGTHLPHALSYAVSHLVHDYRAPDYPGGEGAFIPHGISVIVNSPSVFRFTAAAAPKRHLDAAQCLGAETRDATREDAGEVVAARIIQLMQAVNMPNGLGGVGLSANDSDALAHTAANQRRAIGNAPRDTTHEDIAGIFADAVEYW